MFKTQNDCLYDMPAHFGGPKFDPEYVATQRITSLVIRYETDGTLLENYVPEGFELRAPEVQVEYSKFSEINWMAGGSYNLLNVSAPVRFNGTEDSLNGNYVLVTWESNTTPILVGREQTGIPKIFAEVEDLQILKPHYTGTASYNGNTFFTVNFEAANPVTGREFNDMKAQFVSINAIGWRYIPRVGVPGAELSQFVLFPQGVELEAAQIGTSTISWVEQTWMQNPVQYHIINSLASLPVRQVTLAAQIEGSCTLNRIGAKVLH